MRIYIAALLVASSALVWPEEGTRVDPGSGLIEESGWRLVNAHCSGCHDLQLVIAQRGNRVFWEQTIRWMQKNHNLWQFDHATEKQMLDYLAKHYAPEFSGRRRPLPASLRPG